MSTECQQEITINCSSCDGLPRTGHPEDVLGVMRPYLFDSTTKQTIWFTETDANYLSWSTLPFGAGSHLDKIPAGWQFYHRDVEHSHLSTYCQVEGWTCQPNGSVAVPDPVYHHEIYCPYGVEVMDCTSVHYTPDGWYNDWPQFYACIAAATAGAFWLEFDYTPGVLYTCGCPFPGPGTMDEVNNVPYQGGIGPNIFYPPVGEYTQYTVEEDTFYVYSCEIHNTRLTPDGFYNVPTYDPTVADINCCGRTETLYLKTWAIVTCGTPPP